MANDQAKSSSQSPASSRNNSTGKKESDKSSTSFIRPREEKMTQPTVQFLMSPTLKKEKLNTPLKGND